MFFFLALNASDGCARETCYVFGIVRENIRVRRACVEISRFEFHIFAGIHALNNIKESDENAKAPLIII